MAGLRLYRARPAELRALHFEQASDVEGLPGITVRYLMDEANGHEVVQAHFTTIQGHTAYAELGEYIAQEPEDQTKWYPIFAATFEKRWEEKL